VNCFDGASALHRQRVATGGTALGRAKEARVAAWATPGEDAVTIGADLARDQQLEPTDRTIKVQIQFADGTGVVAFATARRTGRMKRRADWLIFILIHLDLSPRQARRSYRRRFGVETSYRCAGKVRGWMTSRNPVYRFMLICLSFFLLNVWLHLRWLFTQVPRRGRRKLDVKRFQLSRFAKFIVRALELHYGCVSEITAPAWPRP
jgi:hypothetical protein